MKNILLVLANAAEGREADFAAWYDDRGLAQTLAFWGSPIAVASTSGDQPDGCRLTRAYHRIRSACRTCFALVTSQKQIVVRSLNAEQ
jgi:hypothetical protein